jgi:hypothetical protein
MHAEDSPDLSSTSTLWGQANGKWWIVSQFKS